VRINGDRSLGWIRRMLPLVAVRKGTFITALALSAAALAVGVATPRVVMAGIDSAIVARSAGVLPYVAVLLALAATQYVVSYLGRVLLLSTGYGIELDLRNIVFAHLVRLSYGFHARAQTGQLVSRANTDIRAVQLYLTFAPSIAVMLLSAVAALVVMFTVSVPLAAVAVSTMPLVYFAGLRMRDQMFPVSWLAQARAADVATIVEENVSGVRVVKSFAAERRQLDELARAALGLRWAAIKRVDLQARWAPVMQNLPGLGLALVLLYGGWLVIHGQVTLGALVAFNSYILMLQAPFRMLGFVMAMEQQAAASADRIFQVLDQEPEIQDRVDAVELEGGAGDVEFRSVTYGHPGEPPVLDGFDLRLAAGTTLALVGRTGSGKSTAARLLLRFHDPTRGSVRIDGHDVRDLSQASLRRRVGAVFDEPFLFSMSIRDNIAYGRPDATVEDIISAARAACADGFITQLPEGYDTLVGERGYTLSGGQRQRIALARTLLMNPRLLILDDATSAIDVGVEQEIHNALRTLLSGRTTLIIAHRLSTISLADRVALLEGGRIVAEGTHAGLLEHEPRYAAVLAQVEAEAERVAQRAEFHGASAAQEEEQESTRRNPAIDLTTALRGVGGPEG
jgi:ATP-binding cassette subfamily B protein